MWLSEDPELYLYYQTHTHHKAHVKSKYYFEVLSIFMNKKAFLFVC